jgi:hypothetical protein
MSDEYPGWDDSFTPILTRYGEEDVRKALWLQEKIASEGLEGIHFTDTAEQAAEQNAADHISSDISSELKKNGF